MTLKLKFHDSMNATIQFLWRDRSTSNEFRSGVSLHSHTMYSEESLAMVPHYTAKVPYLGAAVRRHEREYQKDDRLDFSRAFWTPPLTPRQAQRLEEKQIQSTFDLPGFVSLTDHDDIRAGSHLQLLERFSHAPVSTEWTVPFGPTYFHFGVHNLPAAKAANIMEELEAFTANPNPDELGNLFSMLNAYPDLLLVLNHPLWDEKKIGVSEHAQVLGRLLERHGRSFHGLELNGLRSWKENRQAIWLGAQAGLPVVGGGDRHGLEPNAIVNLTRGRSLVEFIHEVRYGGLTHTVLMPQYHEPLKLRILQTMVDVVREYPDNFEGRRRWSDRVFFRPTDESEPIPLASVWKTGGPLIVRHFVGAMRLMERRSVRSALRIALDDRASVWSDQEVAV
jgi:hypothetical protein